MFNYPIYLFFLLYFYFWGFEPYIAVLRACSWVCAQGRLLKMIVELYMMLGIEPWSAVCRCLPLLLSLQPLSSNICLSFYQCISSVIFLCQWFTSDGNSREYTCLWPTGQFTNSFVLSPDYHPFLSTLLVTGLVRICVDTHESAAISESQIRHKLLHITSTPTKSHRMFPKATFTHLKKRHQDNSEPYPTWKNCADNKIMLFEITIKNQLGTQ